MKRLAMLLVAAAMIVPLPAKAEKFDLSTVTCKKFFEYNKENLTLLQRAGVPDDEIQLMRRLYEEVRQYADSLDEDHPGSRRRGVDTEGGRLIQCCMMSPLCVLLVAAY